VFVNLRWCLLTYSGEATSVIAITHITLYHMWIVDAVDVFEPFLKAYVEEFKYKSINTDDWKQFLYKFFHDKVHSAVLFCVFVLLVTLHEGNTTVVLCSALCFCKTELFSVL